MSNDHRPGKICCVKSGDFEDWALRVRPTWVCNGKLYPQIIPKLRWLIFDDPEGNLHTKPSNSVTDLHFCTVTVSLSWLGGKGGKWGKWGKTHMIIYIYTYIYSSYIYIVVIIYIYTHIFILELGCIILWFNGS